MSRERIIEIPWQASELPKHGATIHPNHPFFKIQTTQESIPGTITPISEEEHKKGREPPRHQMLNMCLLCLEPIDPMVCQSLDDRWAVGWHCYNCGYYKVSKEMITHFLKGVNSNSIDPSEIEKYKLNSFPWKELKHTEREPTLKMTPLYLQVACVAQRGVENLREALGEADFFAYPGVFESLAKGWSEDCRDWAFTAMRLQGITFLNHEIDRPNFHGDWKEDKEHKRVHTPAPSNKQKRKVKHFQLVRSELRTETGPSISLCSLAEFSLDIIDREPIRKTTSRYGPYKLQGQAELSRSIASQLASINRISHTDGRNHVYKWTLEEIRKRYDPEWEHLSWDFLFEVLTIIKECLPTDGEYCTMTLRPNRDQPGGPRCFFEVRNKGPIDPSWLRDDFRESFHI